jgi:hypothetical protein
MRNPLATIPSPVLVHVTGGCHKGQQPQQLQQQADAGPQVSVQVGTGAQGGAAIQQALSGGLGQQSGSTQTA